MNLSTHNTNDWNVDQPSLAALVHPLRIELTQVKEGWCVKISSLKPCDAMMALSRKELLENSTIISGCESNEFARRWVAFVDRIVELDDAKAIVHEVEHSSNPLCADFRIQTVVMTDGASLKAYVRMYDDALTLASEAIAKYAYALLGGITSSPDLGLVDSLLERTGLLSIRPIETEVFSTFVDVGISTRDAQETADSQVIYDIYSDSWHGE